MRSKSKQKFLFASLMMLGCSFCLSSCSEDDDVTKEPTLEAVKGDYTGTVIVDLPTPRMGVRMAAAAEAAEGISIGATVKNDTVYFDDFLVRDIMELIMPEEQLDQVVKALGKVKYKMGYSAEFNGVKDNIIMNFTPDPLELTVSLDEDDSFTVNIDISAAGKGTYVLEDKKLTFELSIDKVMINDEELDDLIEPSLKYSLKQK